MLVQIKFTIYIISKIKILFKMVERLSDKEREIINTNWDTIKTKALEKHLECKIEDKIYEDIKNEMSISCKT